MEKSVSLRGHEVTFSIWDIGGHKDFESMLPLVCNDAAAMLLLFDLSKPETLDSIRVWHQKARERNKCAMPLLVGCKFDLMLEAPVEEQQHVLSMSHQFAKAINAPLIFCAPSVPINVTNVFKMILINLFNLERSVAQLTRLGQPVLLYADGEIDRTPAEDVALLPPADENGQPEDAHAGMAAGPLEQRHRSGSDPHTWGTNASSTLSMGV